ncbi:MAG: ROK family protein [Bacteroidetes bacterium]|nr:ROK family protein [Bacteroidota bacterium]
MHQIVAAIDIGGTNTVIGIVDKEGNILSRASIPTTDYPNPKDLVEVVSKKILDLIAFCQLPTAGFVLAGVGIGAPNGNYFSGTIEFAPNLKWKGVIPLAKYFSDTLNVKAVLTNDANAAALGEMYFGGARGMKDFIFVTLGTGLGSGIVVDGKMVYGHDGFAGELGHIIVMQHGRQCGCGRKGCLEQYCSASGIVKTYFEILRSAGSESPKLIDSEKVDAKYIFEKAMGGDENAFYAFNYTGEVLGLALANSVAYTSPEAIFLFGGLAQAGELLFNPTVISFEKNLLNIYRDKIKILPSALPENDAPILGAASLIWNELAQHS